MGEFEKELPNGVGTIGFDMDCDGTREYVKKMFKPDKIDQVLNFYGIPYVYKNEYKKYLRYRIQERHRPIVQAYFMNVLTSDGYDTTDFNFGELQKEYCMKVPTAEQTALDMHINYEDFLAKERKHIDAMNKETLVKKDEQIESMQQMMGQMMEQMKQLQKQVGTTNVLLPNEKIDEGNTPSGVDSTRNDQQEATLENITETPTTTGTGGTTEGSRIQGTTEGDGLGTSGEPFKFGGDIDTEGGEGRSIESNETKKDRRNAGGQDTSDLRNVANDSGN